MHMLSMQGRSCTRRRRWYLGWPALRKACVRKRTEMEVKHVIEIMCNFTSRACTMYVCLVSQVSPVQSTLHALVAKHVELVCRR